MQNKIILFIFLITFIGCYDKKTNNELKDETPEVLTESESKASYKILSNGYGDDIIDKLYNEAIKKDEKLETLNLQIEETTSDSLQDKTNEYLKYKRTNNKYWNSIKNYAESINDSLTKNSIVEIIEILNKKYEKRVSIHEEKMDSIEVLKSQLNDQIILMKLFITEPMISNYQRNELPQIEKLESIIKDYNNLIEKTEEYTVIRK